MRIQANHLVVLLVLAFSAASNSDAQALSVEQPGKPAQVVQIGDIKALPAVVVSVADDAGTTASYACTPVTSVLEATGVELGKSLRGARLAEYALVEAADGYRALFALTEFEPLFREKPVLLCYAKDGGALPAKEGPMRLVVVDEARHGRWVRQVKSIRLGSAS